MEYFNPFFIFEQDILADFQYSKLARLRREHVFKAKYSPTSTFTVNGRIYDEAAAEEAFDMLEVDADLHLSIFNNEKLLEFLEDGKLDFFSDDAAILLVKSDIKNKVSIEQMIATKIDGTLSRNILKFDKSALDLLKTFYKHTSTLSSSSQALSYKTSKRALELFIHDLYESHPSPFQSPHTNQFHEDLRSNVSPIFVEFFEYLPTVFKEIKHQYGKWCLQHVVHQVQKKHIAFNRLRPADLKTLSMALDCAHQIHPTEETTKLKQRLRNFSTADTKTQRTKKTKSNSGSVGAFSALAVVLLLVKIVLMVSKCERNSKQKYYDHVFEERSPSWQYPSELEDKPNINTYEPSSRQASNPAKTAKLYNGELYNALKPELVNSKMVFEQLQLTYLVDVIPTDNKVIETILLNELKKPELSAMKEFKVIFKDRNLIENQFSHDLKKTEDGRLKYTFGQIEDYANHTLTTKRKSYRTYDFVGNISRMSLDCQTKTMQNLSFKYDIETSAFNFNMNEENITLPDYEVNELLTKNEEKRVDNTNKVRLALLIYNMKAIQNKVLKLGRVYTLDNLYRYQYDINDKLNFNNTKKTRGYLSYNSVSGADNKAYFNVNGKNFNIKYIYDFDTRLLQGMLMVQFDDSGHEVERIEIFMKRDN